jgi:catechol 2,3-dioxygenase-like lactoylglutathione lyase family enzyme
MSLRIHHLAFRARDPGATERFYVAVLGLAVVRRDPERGSVWLDAEGAVVMIEPAGAGEPPVPEGSLELVAFAAESKNAWVGRLAAAGVPIEAETAYTLYVCDPDGRRIGLSTYDFRR